MGSARQSAPKLMNIQMELRKCCNHPFLLDGAEAREMGKFEKDLLESGDNYGKSATDIHNHLHVLGYIQTSGKMVLLDKLLPKLREEGHKILIFGQMVKMLDLLSEYFDFRKFKYERLGKIHSCLKSLSSSFPFSCLIKYLRVAEIIDGKVRGNDRQKAIDRFNTQPDSFVFMLSTRAGGVGINLTAADIVIIFDR
jgi:SNF2 family DNA or RNA helicase